MAYQENVIEKEICERFCPYQIGDKVILTKNLALENGFLESGTVLEIRAIAVRQDLKIHAVPLEDLPLCHADIGIFDFELIDTEIAIRVNTTADYWGESLISRKRRNRLLLQLYLPAFCIAICMAILFFINIDYAAIAFMLLLFVMVNSISYHAELSNKVQPDIWMLHDKKGLPLL